MRRDGGGRDASCCYLVYRPCDRTEPSRYRRVRAQSLGGGTTTIWRPPPEGPKRHEKVYSPPWAPYSIYGGFWGYTNGTYHHLAAGLSLPRYSMSLPKGLPCVLPMRQDLEVLNRQTATPTAT